LAVFLDERIQAPSKLKGPMAHQKQQAIHLAVSLCE
jgi:hypothetical protein